VAKTELWKVIGKKYEKFIQPKDLESFKSFVANSGIKSSEEFELLVGDPNLVEKETFVKIIRGEGSRPVTAESAKPYIGQQTAPGSGIMANWVLGTAVPFSAPNADQTIQVVHMTFNTGHFDNGRVDLSKGSDGEFGGGFYVVSGHQTHQDGQSPQGKIVRTWKKDTPKGPNNLVYFSIPKESIQQYEPDNEQHREFIAHMMQHPSGYPAGMTEDDAILMMNEINAKGKVLLFPNDKDRRVTVMNGHERNYHEYRASRDVPDAHHSIVIGPQAPESLANVRQIAFRDESTDLLINGAKRTLGLYEEPRQYSVVEKPQTNLKGKKKHGK
jgi:hypothetical protein